MLGTLLALTLTLSRSYRMFTDVSDKTRANRSKKKKDWSGKRKKIKDKKQQMEKGQTESKRGDEQLLQHQVPDYR